MQHLKKMCTLKQIYPSDIKYKLRVVFVYKVGGVSAHNAAKKRKGRLHFRDR